MSEQSDRAAAPPPHRRPGPTPPAGGVFASPAPTAGAEANADRVRVMDGDDVERATRRMAHEIIERNHGLDDVVLVGLQTGGVPLARSLGAALTAIEGRPVPVGVLDVAFYRDDLRIRPVTPHAVTAIPMDLTGQVVVLVDDVIFTGRTIRAALDALGDHGRPRAVQLAVMVDRGHRELPIRADFVGKNLPTRFEERVDVDDAGVDIVRPDSRARPGQL